MPLDWAPLVELIRNSHRPLLMTHVRPDADGLGSQLGLADALRGMGKEPRVAIASKFPPRYHFLDPENKTVEIFKGAGEPFRTCDAIVVLDTGTWNQLGEFGSFLKAFPGPKAVVDHHKTQDDLGGFALVDTSAEATGRLAYDLIRALGQPVSTAAANFLFAALATDTGWFRHPNATAATFGLAEELVRLGASPTKLYEALYDSNPVARLKLHGVALSRLTVRAGGKIAFTEIFLKDYVDTGAVPGDTEDLINYPRSVEGVEVALLFIEQIEGGTKISFRSRSADVAKLAETYGGGGHKLASGAKVKDALPKAREMVLAAAEKALLATG
jgi:phosphoesterase RecJ-like protein